MMNSGRHLKVVYDGVPDKGVDDFIMRNLKKIGFHCWASGYDHIDEKRDLAFDEEVIDG